MPGAYGSDNTFPDSITQADGCLRAQPFEGIRRRRSAAYLTSGGTSPPAVREPPPRPPREPPKRPSFTAYAAEVAWGLLLVNLILAGVSLLMAPYMGRATAFGFFLGVGVFVSALLVAVLGAFYLLALWFERRERV